MIDEEKLSEIISKDANLRLVEPGIYSAYPSGEMPGVYDRWNGSTDHAGNEPYPLER